VNYVAVPAAEGDRPASGLHTRLAPEIGAGVLLTPPVYKVLASPPFGKLGPANGPESSAGSTAEMGR
jgi:hypothetical protein